MKSFVLAAVLLFSVVNCIPQPPPPPGPLTEKMKKNFDECRAELGISIEEEQELHRKRDFKNEKMRCMPACLMKKDGVLEEGNKLNIDLILEKVQKFKELPQDAKKIFEDCYEKAKDQEDQCEFAQSFVHCSHKVMRPGPKSAEESDSGDKL